MSTNIINLAKEISSRHEALSNEIRVLILSIVIAYNEVKWTKIRDILEDILGKRLNPNIIAFHIRRLIEAGYIEKRMETYTIGEAKIDIKDLNKLIKAISGRRYK